MRPERRPREGATGGAGGSTEGLAHAGRRRARGAEPRQARGVERRAQVVQAAADLVLERGPAGVTHRAVAQRAGASLSATTYYFADLDELLTAAGKVLMQRWVEHGRAVLDALPPGAAPDPAAVVVRAVLPPTDEVGVLGHYEHLLGASRAPALARAYGTGREELDRMVAELLERLGLDLSPSLVLAVVDGGVVSALSEGRPVRATCERLVGALLG